MKKRSDPAAQTIARGNLADSTSQWAFGPPDREIRVENAELLLAQLPIFLNGWPCRRLEGTKSGEPDIAIIERPDDRIEVNLAGPGALVSVFDNEFDAADGFASALVAAFVARHSDALCLHAGSALLGSGLVVLLGDSLAGKSSVALHLAASGYRLFGDDRLAIRTGEDADAVGICLGLTPKVRLPLPADSAPGYVEYVESFTEIRDDTAAYLKLWEGEAAVFLEKAPIGALVILDRSDEGACSIAPASRPEAVKALLAQCFAPQIEAQDLVPALSGLASGAACLQLRFSNSGDAASLLAATFRDTPAG